MNDCRGGTNTEKRLTPKTMCQVVGGMLLLWLVFGGATLYLANAQWFHPGETERAGQLGDMFGGANAFFAAVAVSLVGISTMLQTHELREQRKTTQAAQEQLKAQLEELKLARDEAARTRAEHAKSAEALADQVKLTGLTAYIHVTEALANMDHERKHRFQPDPEVVSLMQLSKELRDMLGYSERVQQQIRDQLCEFLRYGRILAKFGDQVGERLPPDGTQQFLDWCDRAHAHLARNWSRVDAEAFVNPAPPASYVEPPCSYKDNQKAEMRDLHARIALLEGLIHRPIASR